MDLFTTLLTRTPRALRPAPSARTVSPLSLQGAGAMHLTLSIKQRMLLHGLLHRDLGKCSIAGLTACQRSGWSMGSGGGHQLTTAGRRLAELSEDAPADRQLELALS
jgi:hypothetical protein